MIRVETQVPSNYYLRSRDFQLLGRIYDAAINSSKGYADMVRDLPAGKNTDRRMLDLMAKTVGFDAKRKYDDADLLALCRSLKSVVRMKGSRYAVEACVRLMLRSQNVGDAFSVDVTNMSEDPTPVARYAVTITVPKELEDIALLEDLLDYVLPVGYVYSIVVAEISRAEYGGVDATTADAVDYAKKADAELGHVYDPTEGDGIAYATEMSTVYSSKE